MRIMSFRRGNPNLWLGQPATAQGVVPQEAGLSIPDGTKAGSIHLWAAEVTQRTGAADSCALVALLRDSAWEAGQWTNATTTYTLDTADAQSGVSNQFALETSTVNDGFLVGADVPFNAISVDVTTAGSGTAPTHVLEYWNGAWSTVSSTLVWAQASADWAAGERLILFEAPVTWRPGGSGTNVPQNRYNIRVRRTNATQATAALARRLYVGVSLGDAYSVASGTQYVPQLGVNGLLLPTYYTAVGAAFGTANAQNVFGLAYSFEG